ncbi:MAG: hypothetical protein JW761_03655 [Prolixibacteraceae bacterium]|nr:hypothetical protein [Prolixibacteraceae bacterium]
MKILRGTIFGGIAFFLLGWVVYGILLMDFMMANMNQCAGRPDAEMIWWAMIVSNLILALFITLVLKWSGAKSVTDGLKTGAIIGFLTGLSMDLSFYSMTTMFNNLTTLIVDVIVYSILLGVVGIIIVLTWGKEK